MTFATEFKMARLAAGLSQPQTATFLNVSVSTVRNWEKGRSEPPDEPVLCKEDVMSLMNRPPGVKAAHPPQR